MAHNPHREYTVSPAEKLTNRTGGTLPVRSRYRSWYGRGSVVVRSQYGRGVRSRYSRGMVAVRSWYGRGAVMVRSSFGRGVARHSMVMVRSRYSLGTLPVRSWYGTLKVRSRLVFSTRLEPGTRTVRFIVRIVQSRLSWIRFGHRYYTL